MCAMSSSWNQRQATCVPRIPPAFLGQAGIVELSVIVNCALVGACRALLDPGSNWLTRHCVDLARVGHLVAVGRRISVEAPATSGAESYIEVLPRRIRARSIDQKRSALMGIRIVTLGFVSLAVAAACSSGVDRQKVVNATGNISDRAEMLLTCYPGAGMAGASAGTDAAIAKSHCAPDAQRKSLETIKEESDALKSLASGAGSANSGEGGAK
jgi:hypothetical protein